MPDLDRTGPGLNRGYYTGGRGLYGVGVGGTCVCPKCGAEVPHKRGVPCSNMRCPKCGSYMMRKESAPQQPSEPSQ